MIRKMMTLTSLMIVVFMLSACGAYISINPFTAEETVTQSFTADGSPRIVVEMFNGSVDVVTGSDTTLKVDVIKRGGGISQQDAADDLKNVEVTMMQDGDTIRVVAKRTDQRIDIGNSGASDKLRVPNGAILDLHSSNGSLTSSGPVGDVKAQTSNGPIDVRGSSGQLDLNTSNGNIVVALPADAQFVVDADTSNAKIRSDFAVTAQDFSDNHLSGTVGSDPGTTLILRTSNGPIEIRESR